MRRAWVARAMALAVALLTGGTATGATCPAPPSGRDAAPVIRHCLDALPTGGTLLLQPRRYALRSPLVLDRSITVTTLARRQSCARAGARCAILAIEPMGAALAAGEMPITVTAAGVTLLRVIVEGHGGRDPAADKAGCGDAGRRPEGGGLRIRAARFTLDGAVIRQVTCYTAMEVTTGVDGLIVRDSLIGPNGDHHPGEVWADGLTVHDATRATVERNLFIDNTDVQLIFGGCRDCVVRRNRFRHSGSFAGSSYAELMLHSWPASSGRYDGTEVSGNAIDCADRRCGFGIMLGAAPWYDGRAAGGAVHDNSVRGAMIGLDIDGLTGPMSVLGNRVTDSGGHYASSCGERDWPAVNVAPGSRRLVNGLADAASVDTRRCLLNQNPR